MLIIRSIIKSFYLPNHVFLQTMFYRSSHYGKFTTLHKWISIVFIIDKSNQVEVSAKSCGARTFSKNCSGHEVATAADWDSTDIKRFKHSAEFVKHSGELLISLCKISVDMILYQMSQSATVSQSFFQSARSSKRTTINKLNFGKFLLNDMQLIR